MPDANELRAKLVREMFIPATLLVLSLQRRPMKKRAKRKKKKDELRREYDLSQLKGGVRGKCVSRYRGGCES